MAKDNSGWLVGLGLMGALAAAGWWRPRRGHAPSAGLPLAPAAPVPLGNAGTAIPSAGRPGLPLAHHHGDAAVPVARINPFRQSGGWWWRVAKNTVVDISRGRLLAVAAGVVFYALLAIFPTITAFVSFYGLFASYDTINQHIALLSLMLPPNSLGIVEEQILRITTQGGGGKLTFAFGFGLLFALWSANNGIKAMMDALNAIRNDEEHRSFVRLNLVSLSFTLGAILFLLMAVGAVVAFPLIMSGFGLASVVDLTTALLRWPMLLLLTILGLGLLYRFGPSRRGGRRWFSPGTMLAALLWLAGSASLSLYLSNFADYNATYGSLGAAIGMMMWMWLSTIVILVGAELDSEIDKMAADPLPETRL